MEIIPSTLNTERLGLMKSYSSVQNGIDIKLNKTDSGGPSLNVEELLIFYFLVARSEK